MSGDRLSSLSILHMHMQAQQCRYWQRSFRIFSSLREMSRLSCSYIYSLWYTNVHLYQQYQRKKNKQQSYWPFSVFLFFDVWKIPLQIMGNGISEELKIKLFWARMPQTPPPPRGSRLRRLFHYAFLCVPTRKNHATPLWSFWYYLPKFLWSVWENQLPTKAS